ncbi:discoidin domain-containing protein [Paenibacillus psychroresistens]|uniref:Discoidin domain-containing protein n=1 Tax=Paenibacillus psychroresistens TaxID=1778678 RepID=A0A6B8RVK9_9BACL|nr:discoidin domain-containing protein [Paenibacillus psychroresistens]QGQ99168.1 discoidin domain-containing protein [Paenibacillus psychroresistens]
MVKMYKKMLLVMLIVTATFVSFLIIPKHSFAADTDWMYDAKWGVWVDYMADDRTDETQSTWTQLSMNSTVWNNLINNFDVTGLANQLAAAKTGYVTLTLGQNSGFVLSPNSTYDLLMGYSPARTSTRDLVNDLYNALNPKGIKLMLYIPSAKPGDDYSNPTGWANVIREWSVRYGTKISGWWFDGYYGHTEVTQPLSDAVHAGNPTAAITFNPGVGISAVGRGENYTAGEINDLNGSCGSQYISNGSYNEQCNITTFLSNWWGKDGFNNSTCCGIPSELVGVKGPKYSNAYATSRIKTIIDSGGVIQLDVPIMNSGLIWSSYLSQLNAIGAQSYRDSATATNLALNKTATVSEYYNNMAEYNGAKAVDGDGASRWATNDTTTTGWLVVDFGTNITFNKTITKQFDPGGQRIKDYKIQYWNGSSWLDAYSGTTPALNQADTFTAVTGSKIRLNILNINGTMGPSIWEFEVYNTNPANLALNKNVTVSEYYNNMTQYNGAKAVDGDGATRWATNDITTSGWLEVDFGTNTTFNKTVIKQFEPGGQRIKDYKIQYWNGSSWLDAYSGTTPGLNQANTFSAVTGSKIRLNIVNINGTMGPSIWEFEVKNQ